MKNLSIIIVACLSVLFTIAACTPYDSNRVNKELVQGKWQLVDVEHELYDTIAVDYASELTYLIFEEDTCIQYMPDLNDTLKLMFSIRDFQLAFIKDSLVVSKFNIDSLTDYKLVLSQSEGERVYKRVE